MKSVVHRMSDSNMERPKPKKSLSDHNNKHTMFLKEIKTSDGENIFELGQHFLGEQEKDNIAKYKHNLRPIDESYELASDDGRRIKSATVTSDLDLRTDTVKVHQFRRYSAPEFLNGNDITINNISESLCGSNISCFYNLWNRPKCPQRLGRGSLPVPKELKLSGQFRDCGCPTRDEKRRHKECKGSLSTEIHHHSM